MKEIKLTQGKVAIVDDVDYEQLIKQSWCAMSTTTSNYYAVGRDIENKKNIMMHHIVIGKKDGFVTDHINGNGLDNRRCNLRHVTIRQNAQNQNNRRIPMSSKYPGVRRCKYRWVATITHNRVRTHLGYFKNEVDAFEAYKNAVMNTTGEEVLYG